MNTHPHRNRFHRWRPALLAFSFGMLSLCAPLHASLATWLGLSSTHNNEASTSAHAYLLQADTASPAERPALLLKAADTLITDQKLQQALTILQSIPFKTDATYANDWHQSWARWYMARHQPWKAITSLKRIQWPPQTPEAKRLAANVLLAQAYTANNQQLSAMTLRIQMNHDESDQNQQQQNNQAIWRAAGRLTESQLQAALDNQPNEPLLGWLQLSQIARQAEANQANWKQALIQWQQSHPHHAGATLINTDRLTAEHPTHQIAMLLPTTGPLGARGQAIYHGALTAFYATPIPKPKLMLYDTHTQNINDLYQQAIRDGADAVIGPLNKNQVRQLSTESITVPTIFLNAIDDTIDGDAPVLEFALSPTDEAKQIGQHIWAKGYRRVLVIAVKTAWGEHLASAFEQSWETLGGQVADTLLLHNDTRWATQIRTTMGVDASEARIQSVRDALRHKVHSTPIRRADIDCICLLTTPLQTREIVPLLRFYYAGNLPLYALSQTDPGYSLNPNYYRDLQAVHLPTTHWMTAPEQLTPTYQAWYQTAQHQWPRAFKRYRPFFGLGMDAFQLSQHMDAFLSLPSFFLHGASGQLHLQQQQIHRQLLWGTIRDNRVVLDG